MGNRIISFASDPIQQRLQDNPYEVFLDISTQSTPRVASLSADLNIDNYVYHVNKLINVNAIRNSLQNIFQWIPGERVLLPEFGSNLRKLLYEGITTYNVEQIIAEIKHVISQWEPRVQVVSIADASTIDDHENNTIHLKIIYVIPGLSDAQFEYDYVQTMS